MEFRLQQKEPTMNQTVLGSLSESLFDDQYVFDISTK